MKIKTHARINVKTAYQSHPFSIMRDTYTTITKVANGYTVEKRVPRKGEDNIIDPHETYICTSLDEALKMVEDYFTKTV